MNVATPTEFTDELDASPPKSPPPTPIELAPKFPQLEIIEVIGRGGMGIVYKARQKTLDRLVALKLLAPEKEKDQQFAERFVREAKTLAQLNHPNIVTVHDFGETDGLFYLLMEYVDGVNLRRVLGEQKLAPQEALEIVPIVCGALQFAHERGVVHRDIKPENILLDKQGRVKIADFGIARILNRDAADGGVQDAVVGTPRYMAPEQKSAPQRADSRADIYSLGVVFYEMLTGELPGPELETPSSKVRIDVRLDEIVLRALEKSPELRYQTAAELRTQIETVVATPSSSQRNAGPESGSLLNQHRPDRFNSVSILIGLGLVLAALITGGFLLKQTNRSHSDRYTIIASRIPNLQNQWSAAKAAEASSRAASSRWEAEIARVQKDPKNIARGENEARRKRFQEELAILIQRGDEIQAEIAATHKALNQMRYPFAQVVGPVIPLLLGGFYLLIQGGAHRSKSFIAISVPVAIAIAFITFSLVFSERRSSATSEKEKGTGTIQTSNYAPAVTHEPESP